ncbi:taurine ABC transporter permease [Escherichia coli]|nr:taurine ABC transporter permease [Escherichia coli]
MATPVKKWLLRVAPWFLPVGIVAVWQLASSVGWLSTRILPSPEGVVMALIPLVILWFGIDESAKIFLVALGTLFPIYINTWHGIRNIDRGLVEMARSYGLSGIPLFIHVILPGALPSIMVGVRFALGLMWLTLIVAETISANSGIGYLAMNAREFLQTDVVVVAIILYALLGKLADVSAQLLERLWLRWNPAYHLKEATV